jgi:hypothetical protein
MNKPLRVATVAFIVGATMLTQTPNVYAAVAFANITCEDPDSGEQQTFYRGWDNFNQYFADKGNIPRYFCEGGFAGPYTIYISDSLLPNDPQRYYAGIIPEPLPIEPTPILPTPIPEPVVTPTDPPMPSPTPTPSPSDTPVPQPVVSDVPAPLPVVQPEPSPTPTPTETLPQAPAPQPEPQTKAPLPPVEPSEPPPLAPEPPAPAPEPPVVEPDPPIVIELPPLLADLPGAAQVLAAAEAILNVGNDMTPDQRQESQSVVIGAVLVGQISTSIRRVKR